MDLEKSDWGYSEEDFQKMVDKGDDGMLERNGIKVLMAMGAIGTLKRLEKRGVITSIKGDRKHEMYILR